MSAHTFSSDLPPIFGAYAKGGNSGASFMQEVPEYRSEAWAKWRRAFIGGSDIPIIMGASSFKSPFELWQENTGRVPVDMSTSEAAEWGLAVEPLVLRRLCNNIAINRPGAKVTLPANPLNTVGAVLAAQGLEIPCIASLDGIAVVEHEGLELFETLESKLTGSRSFRGARRDSDYWQALWGLMVTGWSRGHIGVLHLGTKLHHFEVERSVADEIQVAEAVAGFWACVLNDTPPESYAREEAAAGVEIQDADPILSMDIERLYEIDHLTTQLEAEAESIEETIAEMAATRGAKAFISCVTSRKANIVHSKGRATTDWKKVAAEAKIPKEIIDRNTKTGAGSVSVRLDKAKGMA